MKIKRQLNTNKKWEILHQTSITFRAGGSSEPEADHPAQTIVDVLLKNRGIKSKREKDEFFKPTPPDKMSVKSLDLSAREISKAINRIKTAKEKKEKVIVFGDYDADGVCATAILWENLYGLKLDVLPYIPERFNEGYGLKKGSVKTLTDKYKNLGLIITVDNGIVANEAVNEASKLGIDVIITDHHQKGKKIPKAYSIIHTDKIGGAGIAWIFAREISAKLRATKYKLHNSLELAAIGTISDQLPLIGPNRSFAKYGLAELNKTERIGLLALFKEAGIKKGSAGWRIGTYEVNFAIAPRINAMGRLEHAIDSLRLLCTKSKEKATDLSYLLGKTNVKRQKIVEEVVAHAKGIAEGRTWEGIIVLHHESYHEGVIGLAASRLVERFYRPAIVFSKGKTLSKASARSISGFNIIKTLRKLDDMLLEGGGHPMAAGFTIKTSALKRFIVKLDKISAPLLSEEVLTKKLKVDLLLDFTKINWDLYKMLKKFDPTGIGNPTPTFVTNGVAVLHARTVGADGRHLKLTLEQGDKVFDAIAFGFGEFYIKLSPENKVDLVYRLEENFWNDKRNLQLKIRDISLAK